MYTKEERIKSVQIGLKQLLETNFDVFAYTFGKATTVEMTQDNLDEIKMMLDDAEQIEAWINHITKKKGIAL